MEWSKQAHCQDMIIMPKPSTNILINILDKQTSVNKYSTPYMNNCVLKCHPCTICCPLFSFWSSLSLSLSQCQSLPLIYNTHTLSKNKWTRTKQEEQMLKQSIFAIHCKRLGNFIPLCTGRRERWNEVGFPPMTIKVLIWQDKMRFIRPRSLNRIQNSIQTDCELCDWDNWHRLISNIDFKIHY